MTLYLDRPGSTLLFRVNRKLRHIGKLAYLTLQRVEHTQPVFLVGSGRSGTDIVAHSLGRSWTVELINEDNPKAFENWRLKGRGVVEGVIRSSRASVLVLKPIVETLKAQKLLNHFKGGKIVFLFRDPYDSINSMARFFGQRHVDTVNEWVATGFAEQSETPLELQEFIASKAGEKLSIENASALYWLLYNESYQFLGLHQMDNVLLVNYELLVEKPEPITRELAKFLDIKWSNSMIRNIYSKSVGKSEKPKLDPEIEAKCLKTFRSLKGKCLND